MEEAGDYEVQFELGSANDRLRELVERVRGGCTQVVLTLDGQPVAAVVAADLLREIEALEDKVDAIHAREALAEYNADGISIPLDEPRKQTGT
jgi:antitoxin (DNA-binding transcriptional repressor) of toxin-antitoxin stability system